MYRILIIEDEPIEREVLKLMLENSNSELDIKTAENGYIALEICKEFKPQVTFVDINMPGINGIETIEEMKNKGLDTKFVILSSQEKFDMAQKAIKLGIYDYVSKPAKITVLEEIIKNIISEIDKETDIDQSSSNLERKLELIKPIIESNCVFELISTGMGENINNYLSFLDYKINSAFSIVIETSRNLKMALKKVKNELSTIGVNCIGECFNGVVVIFIISNKIIENKKKHQIANFLSMVLIEYDKDEYHIGAGDIYVDLKDMILSYSKAVKALAFAKINKETFCVYENHIDGSDIEQDLSNITEEIVDEIFKNESSMLKILANKNAERIVYGIKTLAESKEVVFNVLNGVKTSIEKRIGSSILNDIHCKMSVIMNIATEKELLFYFEKEIYNMDMKLKSWKISNSKRLVVNAINYIDGNYMNDIGLEQVARIMNVSPFYLSKMIKKEIGRTFTDIITEKKVEKAKSLLLTQKSIKEVTYECGFNSQNYFTKIFKKLVGVTPTDFKNNK